MTLTDRRDSTTIHILRFSFNDDPSLLLSSTVSSEPLLEQRLLTLSSTLFATATVRHSSLIFLSDFPKGFLCCCSMFLQLVTLVVSSRILTRDHCVLDTPCFGSIRWVSRNFSPFCVPLCLCILTLHRFTSILDENTQYCQHKQKTQCRTYTTAELGSHQYSRTPTMLDGRRRLVQQQHLSQLAALSHAAACASVTTTHAPAHCRLL